MNGLSIVCDEKRRDQRQRPSTLWHNALPRIDGCCRCRDGYFWGFGREVKSERHCCRCPLLPSLHPPLPSLGLRQFIVSDMTGGFDAIKRTDDIPACNRRTGPNENLTASAPSLLQTIICQRRRSRRGVMIWRMEPRKCFPTTVH